MSLFVHLNHEYNYQNQLCLSVPDLFVAIHTLSVRDLYTYLLYLLVHCQRFGIHRAQTQICIGWLAALYRTEGKVRVQVGVNMGQIYPQGCKKYRGRIQNAWSKKWAKSSSSKIVQGSNTRKNWNTREWLTH